MANPRQQNTAIRKVYKECIEKQVGNEEFSQVMQQFLKDYSRLYFNSTTKNSNRVNDVDVNIDENNLLVTNGEQELVNISLDKNLASGQMNGSTSTKFKNLLGIMYDVGVELEIKSMLVNNTIDKENQANGFSVVAEDKAPTIKQSMENIASKLPKDESDMIYFDIEDIDSPSEYSISLAQKKTLISNFEAVLGVDTKSTKTLDPKLKLQTIEHYIEEIAKVREDASIFQDDYMREKVSDDESYSVPEMIVLMNPDLISKNNVLLNKYNEDGTLLEFDVLIQKREENKALKANQIKDEEKLEKVKKEIDDSFAQLMYEKLQSDHSKSEIKDLRRRLGDDEFLKELDNILEVKSKLKDDNHDLDEKLVNIIDSNIEPLTEQYSKSKNVTEYKETIANMQRFSEDIKDSIERDEQEYSEMSERLDFIRQIKEQVERTKGTLPRYTPKEQEQADDEKFKKRLRTVGIIAGAFNAVKKGAKSIKEWIKEHQIKEDEPDIDNGDEPIDVEPTIPIDEPIMPKPEDEPIIVGTENNKDDEKEKDTKPKEEPTEPQDEPIKPEDEPIETEPIQGPPGKDGEPGKDGKDGEPGKDGENGKDGRDGRDGRDGNPGGDIHVDVHVVNPEPEKEPSNPEDEPIEVEPIEEPQEEPVKPEDEPIIIADETNQENGESKEEKEEDKPLDIEDDGKQKITVTFWDDRENETIYYDDNNAQEVPIGDKTEYVLKKMKELSDNYLKRRSEALDKVRIEETKQVENEILEEVENGGLSETAASHAMDEGINKADTKMGEKMDVVYDRVSKLYIHMTKIAKGEMPMDTLDKTYNRFKQKEKELEEVKQKVESLEKEGTLEQLESVEAQRKIDEKKEREEEKNGKDIS